MPQRRKRKQHDPMLSTIFEQVPFREIRMGFDLYYRRLDSRGFDNLLQFLQISGLFGQKNQIVTYGPNLNRLERKIEIMGASGHA